MDLHLWDWTTKPIQARSRREQPSVWHRILPQIGWCWCILVLSLSCPGRGHRLRLLSGLLSYPEQWFYGRMSLRETDWHVKGYLWCHRSFFFLIWFFSGITFCLVHFSFECKEASLLTVWKLPRHINFFVFCFFFCFFFAIWLEMLVPSQYKDYSILV